LQNAPNGPGALPAASATSGAAPEVGDLAVGWKTTWLDHRVRWNGAFFWTRIIPVPTCKLGKKRMIDLAVLWAFFEAKRAEGLSWLAKSMNG